MFTFMREMTASLWDVDALQKHAFSIDGWSGFKGRDVQEKRLRYLEDVRIETEARNARRGVCPHQQHMIADCFCGCVIGVVDDAAVLPMIVPTIL